MAKDAEILPLSLPCIRRCDGDLSWEAKPVKDIPVPVPRQRYALDEASVIEQMQAIAPAIEIFNFGQVGTPGLSDIDLLCFVPDDIRDAQRAALARIELSGLFSHKPVLLPKSAFADIHWLYPISDLRVVAAPAPVELPAPLTADQKADLTLLDCFNGALVRWKALRAARAESALRMRKSLLNIWSARYSIICAELAGLRIAPRWSGFMDRAADQRATWRSEKRIDRELHLWLLDEVESVLTELVEAAARAIASRVRGPLLTTTLSGGRSIVAPAADGASWSSSHFLLALYGRLRSYHLLSVPHHVMVLLHWEPKGQASLDETARKRAEVGRIRARLAGTSYQRHALLAERLFEHPAGAIHKRLIDAAALNAVIRKSRGLFRP